VTNRAEIFLGIIAVATLATALAQVGVVIVAGLAARRVARLAEQVQRELKPLFGHLNAIGKDASRATALAAAQVERADVLFSDVAARVDEALNGLQASIEAPAREGRAIMTGIRAAFQAIRELRQNGRFRQGRADDDDALFI
jgi:hypothetical protein